VFDVSSTELLLLGAVAVAVIPPKDLPRAMRFAGQWIGRARGMARHFRSGLDEMIRQAELEEIEKKWREENERIMREHPLHDAIEHPEEPVMTALPSPDAPVYTPVDEQPAEPAPQIAETLTDLPPAVLPDRDPTSATTAAVERGDDERGPELPLGLPPKQ
jgi:sec-independent protein translocase protein TatB